jgi:hypothetical protein
VALTQEQARRIAHRRWNNQSANVKAERLERAIRKVVQAAPPLTADQRCELAALLLAAPNGRAA